jgi:signal transduction histidine kinase
MHESIAIVEPLAVLAHELRNPIGAIRNTVVLMEAAGSLPDAMEQARRLIIIRLPICSPSTLVQST